MTEKGEMGETPSSSLVDQLNKLDPMERLNLIAKAIGIKLNPPNKECQTCGGKGYTSVKENGEVVPCMCIYPGFGAVKMNRATRRKLSRTRRKKR